MFGVLGVDLWFNQAHANHGSYLTTMYPDTWAHIPFNKYPFHSQYGDGTEVPLGVIQVRDAILYLRLRTLIKVLAPPNHEILI